MTDLRITHALAEVLRGGDPDLRITHAFVEVLRSSTVAESEVVNTGNFFLLF